MKNKITAQERKNLIDYGLRCTNGKGSIKDIESIMDIRDCGCHYDAIDISSVDDMFSIGRGAFNLCSTHDMVLGDD